MGGTSSPLPPTTPYFPGSFSCESPTSTPIFHPHCLSQVRSAQALSAPIGLLKNSHLPPPQLCIPSPLVLPIPAACVIFLKGCFLGVAPLGPAAAPVVSHVVPTP